MIPRLINEIIIHCTDTPPRSDIGIKEIDVWHRQKGYDEIGYHIVIRLNGTIEFGRAINKVGAHCKGHNSYSIGICYVGGQDVFGNRCDTRTPQQKEALAIVLDFLTRALPITKIHGHKYYNDKKLCPCFDVESEYAHLKR